MKVLVLAAAMSALAIGAAVAAGDPLFKTIRNGGYQFATRVEREDAA